MFRRLSSLLALGLGLLVLIWGLFHLQAIFLEERDDALTEIAGRRRALEQYAHKELEQALRTRLDEARPTIVAAASDPLLPAATLWLRDRGEQLLPRRVGARAGSDSAGHRLYTELAGDARLVSDDEPDSPWGERLALLRELDGALAVRDRAGIEHAVRAILAHRARFVVATHKDVPFTLALADKLLARTRPDATLMRRILRDGFEGARGLDGLQRALLSRRDRFTATDLELLGARTVQLSQQANVLASDFEQRLAEKPAEPLPIPEDLPAPALALDGRWYVSPDGRERMLGVAVQLGALLDEASATMRERGLLAEGDELHTSVSGTLRPMTDLAITVESPRWALAEEAVQARHRLKAALLVAVALLSLTIVGLGYWLYRRKHRFLELKGEFVSAVSHELRTPLASIRLMAETLERRTQEVPRARDYASRIVQDIDGLSFLIENILSFDRLQRGRWVPKLQRLCLADVLAKVDADRDAWTRGREVELTIEGLGEAELSADSDLLQLLFTNLARNACQYNASDRVRLHIRGERQEHGWVVRFRDNGVGIPAGEQERVFDDFYRSKDRSGRGERGSGLGLSICRKVMEAHGGRLFVADTGPEGTTFELRFARGS